MKSQTLRSNLALFGAALIWGFAFTAQRLGMTSMGPFIFNAVRFAIGAGVLWLLLRLVQPGSRPVEPVSTQLRNGLLLGLVIFGGSSLQQAGLVYTTPGKAGFITGLYVVIVPLMGLLWGQKTHLNAWLGAVLAVVGLFLLTVTEAITLSLGDALVLGGAFFWAGHIQLIAHLSRRYDPIRLTFTQFLFASLFSLVAALLFESISLQGVWQGMLPILYTGILSTGVAFSLQTIGQRHAHPASAAIILSLEASFALLGGWLILGETISLRGGIGCLLMLAGMILSQLEFKRPASPASATTSPLQSPQTK